MTWGVDAKPDVRIPFDSYIRLFPFPTGTKKKRREFLRSGLKLIFKRISIHFERT